MAHWSGYANSDISNKMTRGPVNWPHIVLAARQKLKNSKWPRGITSLIKNGLNNVRRGYEDAILGDEEAGADCDKEAIIALSDNWKNGMTGISRPSVAGLD
jgi:hypothetical protein